MQFPCNKKPSCLQIIYVTTICHLQIDQFAHRCLLNSKRGTRLQLSSETHNNNNILLCDTWKFRVDVVDVVAGSLGYCAGLAGENCPS